MHPSGNALVVVETGSNCVELFGISGGTGSLSSHGTYGTGSSPVSAALDPSGRYLFVVNSGSNNISVFSINLALMTLTQVPSSPFNAFMSSPSEITVMAPAN